MIFHASISADEPANVASVIAQIWRGKALPFPFVGEGSWVAFAPDDMGSLVEVYPRGTELFPVEGDADPVGILNSSASRATAGHLAISTDLSIEEVFAIAERAGWPAKYRKRGGAFGLIELWIENSTMLEVLTPEMQQEYRQVMTVAGYSAHLPPELLA